MQNHWKTKSFGENDQAIRLKILEGERLLSFREVFDYWANNQEFRTFYIQTLNSQGFEEFYWEHPAMKQDYLDKPYEFILRKSRNFARREINDRAFSDHIYTDRLIAVFDNLGKNARLVVPTQKSPKVIYKHMASFVREAEETQVQSLFEHIGKTIQEEVEKGKLIWLNTAGLGVIWLHVRMDTTPKYYKTKTYKNPEFLEQ